jgi:hypothetical protein
MIGLFYVIRNVLIQHRRTLLCGGNHLSITTCTNQLLENKSGLAV